MIDLNAPIIPGESAAGIYVGQPISELLGQQNPIAVEKLENVTRYEFGPVWVWTRNDLIDQLGLFQGYNGELPEGIVVGAQMSEVKEKIGDIFEDEEDNLCVINSPGWCFETCQWNNLHDPDENLSVRVTGIFVFAKPS